MFNNSRWAVIISVAAFVISLYTFYISYLFPAQIQIVSGESVKIHYFFEGNLGISIPVSFTNTGAKLATVKRVGLLVQLKDANKNYLLEPLSYQRIDEFGNLQQESELIPITIVGRGNVVKQILFASSRDRSNEFKMNKAGTYKLSLLGWIEDSEKPKVIDTFLIQLTDEQVSLLMERRKIKSRTTLRATQLKWTKWSAHYLTEVEVKVLGIN